MGERVFRDEEIKITAILYANKRKVVEYLKKHGKLPRKIDPGGMHIGMRVILSTRGRDPVLTEKEQLVYDAILRERRLPGGSVLIIQEKCSGENDGGTRKT
jgi:hypothetical protein